MTCGNCLSIAIMHVPIPLVYSRDVYEHPTPLPTPLLSPLPPPPLPGLLGVSPSPSNCSSVDISTNTCTVTAAVGSSLTLCVDFTHYPSDTQHLNPYLTNTAWKREDNDWLWVCGRGNTAGNFSCDNFAGDFPSSVHGDWGRCLELDKVTQNSTFSYEIAVTPSKDYPAAYMNKVKKTGSFRVQGTVSVNVYISTVQVATCMYIYTCIYKTN